MRSFAILATICAVTMSTTSALVDASERTWVDVDANGFDPVGCSPNGCVPSNTRDNDLSANSRWSCKEAILGSPDEDDGCCITYYLEEPQDIVKMRIAFYNVHGNTWTLDVFDNDAHHCTFMTSGSTLEYQDFNLYTDETGEIKLCLNDPRGNTDDVWLSITEVQLLVE